MKLVLAPNAFKESLTAAEAARAIRRGLARALPGAELIEFPVADGGDGLADVLRHHLGGTILRRTVTGPLGRPVQARLLRLSAPGPRTFVVEVAETSGLRLVPPSRRNPMRATSRGLGEMIAAAVERGAERVIVGLGGSATVDGGAGMAQALGFSLLDRAGKSLPIGGGPLERLARIVPPPDSGRLARTEFLGICDVRSPLCGLRGAAAVFGPQKGATPVMVPRLDRGLALLAACLRRDLGRSVTRLPGAGAAGGLGAGLTGFLGASLVPGADWLLDLTGFDAVLDGADWVITGEGRLDAQTLENKAPAVVARRAAARGIPTIGLAGSVDSGLRAAGASAACFSACFSLLDRPMSLAQAQSEAPALLQRLAREVGCLLAARDSGLRSS